MKMKIPELDLLNTPGIYYALTYGISALFFISLNRKRGTAGKRAAGFAGLWAVLFVFSFATYHIRVELFLPSVAVMVLLLFGMIYFCTDMPLTNQVYFTARAYLLGEFAASLEWQLFYYALTALGVPFRLWTNLLFLLIVHGAVFAVLYLLEKPYEDQNLTMRITGREMWTVLILTAVVYAMSNLSYVLKDTPFSSSYPMEIFMLRTLADLGGIAILFGYHMTIQESRARQAADYFQQMMERQYEHFRLSEESIDLVNQKYHDLKHQIAYLKSDITEKQKREYLDEMEEEVRLYESRSQTGNHVVDILLSEKHLQCTKQGIQLHAMVDGGALDFLSDMEICALLGNALDNAMEAAAGIEEPEQRRIRILTDRQKGFVRLCVDNRCRNNPEMKEGIPMTTKQDKRIHGYGVRSMKRIVEKYGGSLQTEIREGWFHLRILIPETTAKK